MLQSRIFIKELWTNFRLFKKKRWASLKEKDCRKKGRDGFRKANSCMKKIENSKDNLFLVKKMNRRFRKNWTDAFKFMPNGRKKEMKRKKRLKS